jgi:peptidylprolyl isomerase
MRTPALLLAFASVPLAAQTAKPAVHRTAAVHHAPVATCAKLPELSPKIPALSPDTSCARPLYTITIHPQFTLDYVAPVVSPELRAMLEVKPETFSLDYVDTQLGDGPAALPNKWYTVKYTGYLPDGAVFDSSEKHGGQPISFPYGGHHVIQGMDSGFEGMHIGGKRRLFIPYQLAYGEKGRPPMIPAKSMLIFDVELVSQSDTEPKPPQPPAPPRSALPDHAPGHETTTPETRPAPSPSSARPAPTGNK